MTLDEAIKIQEKRLASPFVRANEDSREAQRLGFEAMKREQILRREVPYDRAGLLPGETDK